MAGDFLYCCGDERWPRGEKAAWAALEKGVDTGGVAAASCEGVLPCWPEGVRPCCDGACFIGVGVDILGGILSKAIRGRTLARLRAARDGEQPKQKTQIRKANRKTKIVWHLVSGIAASGGLIVQESQCKGC